MSVTDDIPRIKKLSDAVANQIAAGEVIERPASVVKELIENSIDAFATKLQIDIEQAGSSLIRVRDDGQGMRKDDLKLALTQHATSKLSTFSDLSQIASLGFRGEAIPSIASVSRFKMTSRPFGAAQAWSIDNHFELKPTAHAIGTTIEVQDLFFSTPGRRKFLKSEKTEYLHIQSLLRAIALSHFSIGFFVKHHGQPLFRFPSCKDDFVQRVLHVCGRSFLNKSISVDREGNGMRLWGWLGLNEIARSQSDRQYFYVNGRLVRDKHVNHAIRLAYNDRIATGRFPSYILHLQIAPSQVDVNVHPAKKEVRFSEAREVHDLIYSSLLERLNESIFFIADGVDKKPVVPVAGEKQANFNENFDIYNQVSKKNSMQDRKQFVNYFGLFDGQFIVANIDDQHVLIDVAKTRVLLTAQYLLKHFYSNTMITRPILIPLGVELNQVELDLIVNQAALINQWGFKLEQISPNQILIRSLPSRLFYADAISAVRGLLDMLKKHDLEKDIACRLANHVNDAGIVLNNEGVMQLINEIRVFKQSVNREVLPWRRLDVQTLSSLISKQ